jgi:hypothetical protein
MGSEYFFKTDLEVSSYITYFTDYRQTRGAKKISITVLKGILSIFEKFIVDYLRNLKCWEKSKIRFGLSAPKLS